MPYIMPYTRSEILENRKKWIEFLKRPETKKFVGYLENVNNPEERCCLGHACHLFLNDTRHISDKLFVLYGSANESEVAPFELMHKLGLYSNIGNVRSKYDMHFKYDGYDYNFCSLASFNDNNYEIPSTPQIIGEYLESVIEGGDNTPFYSLCDFPEKL